MTRTVWLPSLAVALGLLAPASGDDPKPDPKKKALADLLGKLKEKRQRGGNQVYKLEFERTGFNKGVVTRTCREVEELQIDWETGKFRLTGWTGCAPKPFEIIRVYDGERIKTQFRDVTTEGKPTGDGSWKYGMVTGRLNSDMFQQPQYWPMFFHKGVIAGLDDQFYPGHFVFDVDAEKFFVHGEVVRDGRKCISLKTFPENPAGPMEYEYVIDPKKDHSVVGFTYYRNSAQVYSLDIKVVEAKQRGRWALSEWTFVVWGANANANAITKAKVTDFAEDVPVGDKNAYDIAYPEGAKVSRSHYELPKGKQDQKIDYYQYEVKGGKLIQISGPPEYLDWVRRHWPWFALGGVSATSAVVFRRRLGWGKRSAALADK